MYRKRIVIGAFVVLGLVSLGALGKFAASASHRYLGVPIRTLIESPMAYWRVRQRDWGSLSALHYERDEVPAKFQQNVETILLPLSMAGARLSDAFAVPKLGGAIRVVGSTVIILDRLGGLYSYELPKGPFKPLQTIPPLPNNLKAYLAHRPGPPVNLADATNDEFRARDIIYLADRKELAAAYDRFDETTGDMRTVVSVIAFDPTTFSGTGAWRDVFKSDAFAAGAGISSGAGMLAYRQDGKLYITIGDHYILQPKVSEDPNSTFGKVIEIDLTKGQWRVFTKGHRNAEGITFTRSGQLLSTENGPRGGDELNILEDGADYGWPNVTFGTDYNSYDWPSGTSAVGTHAGYKPPLFAWVPSIAPTQIIEVNHFNPRWDGDLLIATMKASSLYRLRLNDGKVLYSERIWIGDRIRDVAETDDGMLVLWTDDTKLIMITVDKDQLAVGRRMPTVVGNGIINANCLSCHHFGPTNATDFAPSLSNLLNRPIASDTFSYSPALRAKQKLGPWTPALLTEFLSDPYRFASGTNMLPLALSPSDISDIVSTLAEASTKPPVAAASQ